MMRRLLSALVLFGSTSLAGCATSGASSAAEVQRPRIEFTSKEKFDASAVPAYAGRHDETYAHIDANLASHLENLRRWVRQPSVSAQNQGVQEMATMLRDDLRKLGFKEAELVPTDGHPGVWGFYDAGAEKTLVVYMMYDVQPVEPTGWQVGAFDGALVDHALGKVLMARGATNQKGPERAFLNALESIIATRGKLPVNLMVVAEGEEELGSPHYPQVIDKYAERLKSASGVFFPFNSQGPSGDVSMFMGVKGILSFEMEARGSTQGGPMKSEVHGSLKAITDSPVWRLTQAMASLTTPDGNSIRVPGYYAPIRPPNEEEQRLVNGMLAEWRAREPGMRQSLGVQEWVDGMSGDDSLLRYLFDTTLNIDGMWAGYTGPGMKTILPHKATAKLDSRLVPDQTPEESLRLIRAHLDAQGFTDVETRLLSGYPPAQTSVSSSIVQAAISAYNKYGITPSVAPRLGGSAPYYIFTERLKLPLVAGGIGHGSGAHGPDEYMLIEPVAGSKIAGLAAIEKFYVDLLYALAEAR
ncbi:M20/M25/M40 family metallo-hydrolase [Hyalangium rubrum]|uniref:M20/M25/M40 family metallo-hydrolase n=1 Tax=Hyalangium rubrum TaxID=3103134 RepID=A0ABU5H467_9BACT|nr:M20/M25/M40 family metallo-hydrolase [Hyalangium sp. s54d21]MDY7227889.1 M20/M25/M40 family metallo-hydrolase [Hyalangium sp. s54d21]